MRNQMKAGAPDRLKPSDVAPPIPSARTHPMIPSTIMSMMIATALRPTPTPCMVLLPVELRDAHLGTKGRSLSIRALAALHGRALLRRPGKRKLALRLESRRAEQGTVELSLEPVTELFRRPAIDHHAQRVAHEIQRRDRDRNRDERLAES